MWALLQVDGVREAVREVAPLMVGLMAHDPPPPAPAPPVPPPPRPWIRPLRPAPQPPVLAAPTPLPVAADSFTALAPPPASPATPTPEPVAVEAAPAPPAPSPPAPPPPVRKVIAATAVRYLVQPQAAVPRASRRAGEHGVVWLRVVVATNGVPLQVTVQRSSSHPRLDEQALWAMRQARFQPHTEDGRPIVVEVVAPIEYPQE
ncbi:MAG: energy transducer TonB [Rubrivivax sp.]|nr:energy transducer TonB [Rubrivivax sp.]